LSEESGVDVLLQGFAEGTGGRSEVGGGPERALGSIGILAVEPVIEDTLTEVWVLELEENELLRVTWWDFDRASKKLKEDLTLVLLAADKLVDLLEDKLSDKEVDLCWHDLCTADNCFIKLRLLYNSSDLAWEPELEDEVVLDAVIDFFCSTLVLEIDNFDVLDKPEKNP
jgi:hypothetical protein